MRRPNARSPALDSTTADDKMDASKFQFRHPSSSSSSRFSLISRISLPPNSKQSNGGLWISISATVLLLALCLIFVLKSNGDRRFGIVIDGGSTGTRIHVFAYISGYGMVPVVDLGSSVTMKVTPGLSSYAGNPEAAGESLVELLEFGRRSIPRDLWGVTEVRLMATAGLRLLEAGVQDRILESCRRVMRTSGFLFRREWASVITGADEGIYAWVTANYALGTLGNDPQQTTGIIELGGASAQITFVSSEPLPHEFSHVLRFGKNIYTLYSHSFLHFGQNVAYESLRRFLSSGNPKSSVEFVKEGVFTDPCTPRGYSHSLDLESSNGINSESGHFSSMHTTGNFSECRSAALMLLQKGKDKCSYKHCHVGSAFVPELKGRFLATENFFYTSKFFGLSSTAFLSDLVMAGERFCGEDWLKLKRKYQHLDEEDLKRYCFSTAYIVALLHDSLGIALDDGRIGFANQVGGIPLDWALGAFIMKRMSDSEMELSDWKTNFINNNSSVLLSFFVIFVLIFTIWWVSKWRKPQLKTIYDLEKGRYIITRVSP